MKANSIAVSTLSAVLVFLAAAGTARPQPAWTNFTYTDWNPGTAPAMQGWDYQSRLYECRAAWDGSRFAAILSYEAEEVYPGDYRFACSTDGRNWTAGTETETINMPRTWSVSHHALAGDPDGFPPSDVIWTAQSGNVKFKIWYCRSGNFANFRYAESTNGLYWNAALEPDYCPPAYKRHDWFPTTRIMIKPDVLYRPNGSPALDTDNPMNNRYIFYLNSNSVDTSGGSGYFEMYISSNGLDWTIHAWDNQCQTRWENYTTAPAEVSELITFTGGLAATGNYVDAFEEVYENGERQGFMLWVDRYTTNPSIQSYYSTNGFDWISREAPISAIGDVNLSDASNWNYQRNYGLDAVRLGESYFLTRAGRMGSQYYNTGAAIVQGRMSAEVDTPASPSAENITIDYRLFHWDAGTCPEIDFTFSTDGLNWNPSSRAGGDAAPFATGISGFPHTFVWNSLSDIPGGAEAVYFRVQPVPAAGTGSYDTTEPFEVNQPPAPSPTPTPAISVTRTPTPAPARTASPTPSVRPTSSPTPVPTAAPSPSPSVPPVFSPHLVVDWDDYDGDGTSDIAVYDPATGEWNIENVTSSVVWGGQTGDIPVPGDYDGDGVAQIAFFRAGTWNILGVTEGIVWGQAGDFPAPGDYDGDGSCDFAVWRPADGRWRIRGITNTWYGQVSGIFPVPGDYNGDGTTDIAMVWPGSAGGTNIWYVKGIRNRTWMEGNDLVKPMDYDGDGTTDLAVYRPSNGGWYIRHLESPTIYIKTWGVPALSDLPVVGDFDGDGMADLTVLRANKGRTWWWILYSSKPSNYSNFSAQTSDIIVVGASN